MMVNIFNDGDNASNIRKDDLVIVDSEWVKNVFMVRSIDLDKDATLNRFWSTANAKFTDTTLGGNIAINPKPQFTRYCDVRSRGRISKRQPVTVENVGGNYGMGEYYSENIDDNAQKVFLEFGVPEFNSLAGFFINGSDTEMRIIAKTGRPATAYNIGRGIGTVAFLIALPGIGLAIMAAKLAVKVLSGDSVFRYYYLKPSMHLYWSTVNTLCNRLAVELGIMSPELSADNAKAKTIGMPVTVTKESMAYLKELMPDIVSDSNYLDIFAVATRAQRLANSQILADRDIYEKNPDTVTQNYSGFIRDKYSEEVDLSPSVAGISGMLNKLLSSDKGKHAYGKAKDDKTSTSAAKTEKVTPDSETRTVADDGTISATDKDQKQEDSFTAYFDAVLREGGGYAVFQVDYIGSVSESFSNSVGELPTASAIKGMTTKMRNYKFSTAGGNILPGMDSVISSVTDVAMGVLDGVTMGFAGAIGSVIGGSFTDLPKIWTDSTATLPTITFKTRLQSTYGNPISQFKDMYIPLMMLLAGTLPLATGKASYESPFLANCFVKGILKSRLGMLTSLSVTKGVSNLGYNKSGRPLAIDVSFTFTDFSSVMSAPINTGMFNGIMASLDEGTAIDDYLSVLAARDLLDNKYLLPRLKRKYARAIMELESITSPAAWGMTVGGIVRDTTGGLGGLVGSFSLNLSDTR